MKFFSTFSGVEGFGKGITDSIPGAECIGVSEIDKYASQVLKYHYPEVKNYGDIRKIKPEDLPDFEMLCGGFPCQSFSIAGQRLGFDDTRGTLFYEIARIAKIKRPSILFLENVKGLLNHEKGRTFKTIIATLDELGYDAEWELLNSKYFGVPQNRERVFIIGHLRGRSWTPIFPICDTNKEDTRTIGKEVSYSIDANYAKGSGGSKNRGRRQIVKQNMQELKGILEKDAPEKYNMTDKQVEQLTSGPPGRQKAQRNADRPSLKKNPKAGGSGHIQKVDETYCLDTGATQAVQEEERIRRLTPRECERLQGFPDDWTTKGINEKGKTVDISDSQRYKMMGNAVTVNVIRYIASKLKDSIQL